MDFNNKTALITGGSRGIGLAVAKKLARMGVNIWILARDEEQLETAKIEIRKECLSTNQIVDTLRADVSKYDELKTVVEGFLQKAGTPDFLINSAGVVQPGNFEKLDPSSFKWMMDINYLGMVYITQMIIPGMMERKSGWVVNISSLAGIVPLYGYSGYSASKFAVRGFSDVLRSEMIPHKVNVAIVFPPDTDTDQLQYDKLYKPEVTRILTETSGLLSPEAVADAIISGINKNYYMILPGWEGKVLYRLSHLGSLFTFLLDIMVWSALKKSEKNRVIH
jgi:3-dehydrosphinganine reductase